MKKRGAGGRGGVFCVRPPTGVIERDGKVKERKAETHMGEEKLAETQTDTNTQRTDTGRHSLPHKT